MNTLKGPVQYDDPVMIRLMEMERDYAHQSKALRWQMMMTYVIAVVVLLQLLRSVQVMIQGHL